MMDLLSRLFARGEPVLSEARAPDTSAIARLHGEAFVRGWSDEEIEQLLLDSSVVCHRACIGNSLVGFILSRVAADEAEVLSIAVASSQRGRGTARRLLVLHLRRLAGLGVRRVFLEVGADNEAAGRLYTRAGFREVGRRERYYPQAQGHGTTALILQRDLE
jgi:[ribosomal protein S18]-alanine N-acetyltransferase